MSAFNVCAVYPTSNWGGFELEINSCGDSARVRENYGEPKGKPRWQEIKYKSDGEPYVTHYGVMLELSNFMRV